MNGRQWKECRGLGLALVFLGLCGCLVPERRIVATVRDPGAVSLHVVSRDGVNKEVLAGDGRPGSATAASGTFPTGGSSSASYELDADRLPDHTIRLRWVHPPIVGGEIDTVLPPSGRMRLLGTDDVASTIRLDAPTLRVPYTAFITPSTDSLRRNLRRGRAGLRRRLDGDFNGYAAARRGAGDVTERRTRIAARRDRGAREVSERSESPIFDGSQCPMRRTSTAGNRWSSAATQVAAGAPVRRGRRDLPA